MKPTLLIMAAGMGSRYGALKQIDGVGPNAEAIMDYSIYDAIQAGFGKVVFVIRKDFADQFYTHVVSNVEKFIDCQCVFQDDLPEGFSLPEMRTKPWGTAHAILTAKDVIPEPFAAINADDFYGREAYFAVSDFLSKINVNNNNYCMVGYKILNTLSDSGSVSRGVCEVDANNMLISTIERKNIIKLEDKLYDLYDNERFMLKGDEIVSMNLWGFTPLFFAQIENSFKHFLTEHINEPKSELFIPTVIYELLKSHNATVEVLNCGAKWFGVTYHQDKQYVMDSIKSLIANNIYPEKLWTK